ncbi:tRNA (N(6)-L-threonylcarbamoyladenosine(37)-C(2))-methylthiotransferase MtaB [Clostridium sp. AM58-1XD]|uniref:tRNA (N(6)-L-threonylcarbamoyladenosine(37)-C(2))- methylthiotransferase MtaB n=1 Tax=Clostridium sp. AM58-1XD TaxID=2292307 RepID=UPI000E468FB8|nr:tRNA (N(6)-L-threonylcarbamoyladenosine(37)-C(2))-methylthiotransferase MtaB [Clostridium sp. AM58-1XD]RGY97029.1 tRNA (N(6)-L-threonylcarbamoyladenosine(37)-C(2))-methylthiotransferase MtaB [Clostridium sp. AM58-1XD]
MRKAALHNLGCKVNSYETEAMQQMLEAAGYEIVPFAPGADVYIINTCSVTNIADRKSRQMLHKAKKMNPSAVVVAAGCYVQAAGEKIAKDEAVDIVIGNNKKTDLIEILENHFRENEICQETPEMEESYIIDIAQTHDYEDMHIEKTAGHTRAFIKVQDGCNQFCSYCIIPYTRGRVRSRSMQSVEKEVRALAERGYKEIVLTGIHLSSYGVDFPEEERTTLLELIVRLHEIEGLERIRLGSLEPRIVTREFAGALAGMNKICPHFHLSLQSGCDETLKRMNRRYTTEEYLEGCRILREAFDRPAITTDVIVGFPGETEEEFRTTEAFLRKAGFYEMHVFKYSRRKGTKADRMEGQLTEAVKAERSDRLLKLEKEMSKSYRESFLDKNVEILLEEKAEIDGKPYLTGYTKEYVKGAVPYEEGRKGGFANGKGAAMLNDEIMLLSEESEF